MSLALERFRLATSDIAPSLPVPFLAALPAGSGERDLREIMEIRELRDAKPKCSRKIFGNLAWRTECLLLAANRNGLVHTVAWWSKIFGILKNFETFKAFKPANLSRAGNENQSVQNFWTITERLEQTNRNVKNFGNTFP